MWILGRVAKYAVGAAFSRHLRRQIRIGSAKALKHYVDLVGKVRIGALVAFGMALVAAFMAGGTGLLLAGSIWMLVEGLAWPQIAMAAVGFFLLALTGTLAGLAFSEKRWLQMSGATRLIEAVLAEKPVASSALALPVSLAADFVTGGAQRGRVKASKREKTPEEIGLRYKKARTGEARSSDRRQDSQRGGSISPFPV